jgi:hypothetical protein
MLRLLLAVALLGRVAGAGVTVTVRSTADNSHATTRTESKKLEDLMRRTIEKLLARAPIKLPSNRTVDASLVSLTTAYSGNDVTVSSVIRVVVSDDSGRITSVLGTSAKVVAANKANLPELREEAVIGALEGGYAKVRDRLHGKPAAVVAAPAGH